MHRDKIEPDTSGLFWGKPYEILIEKRLTGAPESTAIPFHTGRRVSSPPWTNVDVRITNTTRW